jgi:glycosyltransferase involved in cell wall biosynthesis
MKILLVAGFFPPYAPISATRVNKLAKYFHQTGHDIRVLAAHNQHYPPVMAVEIPADRVVFAPVFEVTDAPSLAVKAIRRLLGGGDPVPLSPASQSGDGAGKKGAAPAKPCFLSDVKSRLMEFYRSMVSVPDARIGWYPYALREGRKMLKDWTPDVIYASAPPHTSLLVASRLAREFNIPWFCEYRDLWGDHPYYDGSWLRRLIEKPLENHVLASCRGLVTVTGTWAEHLKKVHGLPVAFVMNGFDPDDYAEPGSLKTLDADHLTILYAGGIYPGKRDPSTLFKAMKALGKAAEGIRVHFYMPPENIAAVKEMAIEQGVGTQVVLHDLVKRDAVIDLQQRSDILLLLRWDSPEENGVLAGKLFEYIGSGRPILSLGSTSGEAADFIREYGLGFVSKDAGEVADQLRKWLEMKAGGGVPAPKSSNLDIFSRPFQFKKLESFLSALLKKQAGI